MDKWTNRTRYYGGQIPSYIEREHEFHFLAVSYQVIIA